MRKKAMALAGAAAGLAVGVVAERSALKRRRRNDPEAAERFGERRGERSRMLDLPDGARLFVEEVGPKSPRGAVFLHGSVLRTDVWHYQMTGLGRRRLVFYDLRGHGLSEPKGDSPYSLETLADDLLEVIESSKLREIVLVGHSVGGMVALVLCTRRPELVGTTIKGLVLVNSTHRPAVETIVGGAAVLRLERLSRHPLDVLGKQSHRIDRLRKVVKPSDAIFWAVALAAFGPQASARQIDFTYDMLSETSTDVIFDLIKCYRDYEVEQRLGDIAIPALVIGGTHDRITVPGASEYLAAHLPKAELKLFSGSGHMTMLEQHREFNSMLESFLNDTLGSGKDRR